MDVLLAVLFLIQFAIPIAELRMIIGVIYVLLGIWIFARERVDIMNILNITRLGLRDPRALYTLRDQGRLAFRYVSQRRPRVLEADLLRLINDLPNTG